MTSSAKAYIGPLGNLDLARLMEQDEAHLTVVSDADLAPLNPDSSKYDLKCWIRLLSHIGESLSEAKRRHREFHNASAALPNR